MSYWKQTDLDTEPSRFVQFTSSGFKKVLPEYLRDIDLRISRAQQLVRAESTPSAWAGMRRRLLSDKAKEAPARIASPTGRRSPMLIPPSVGRRE